MRASPIRLILLAAPVLILLPLALAGCYTVLSHPTSGMSDPGAPLAIEAPHAMDAAGGQDCMRCHVGHGGADLDAIGLAWNRSDQRHGLDPNWPSAYANWLGYLPDPWLDYYRDPYWRDPWLPDPWSYAERPVIVIGDGGIVDTGPPPETGTRHLWGRPELYTGPVPIQAPAPSSGGSQDASSPQREPIQGEIDRPATPQPDRQENPPPAPSEPEKGGRHLWGRPR
jgi:hypothetical protein